MPANTPPVPRKLLPSLILNAAAPLILYLVLRGPLGSDTIALAIGAAVPLVVTVVEFIVRRKIDPIGVIALVAFAILFTVLVATGGDPLVLKLHDAIITGPLGLVCLGSVLIRKPLILVALRMSGRKGVQPNRQAATVLTVIIGAMLFVHAMLILGLALTLPTTTFVTIGRPIGWVVLALGVGALMWYRNKVRATAQH